jgi:lambda repressor-like predicted transcriptional regulator
MAQGVNPDGSLKPRAIRALLKFKGREITDLAETLGFSEAYFRQVIDRIRRDWRVEDAIAQALDLEADRIWGRRSEGAA